MGGVEKMSQWQRLRRWVRDLFDDQGVMATLTMLAILWLTAVTIQILATPEGATVSLPLLGFLLDPVSTGVAALTASWVIAILGLVNVSLSWGRRASAKRIAKANERRVREKLAQLGNDVEEMTPFQFEREISFLRGLVQSIEEDRWFQEVEALARHGRTLLREREETAALSPGDDDD